MKNIFKTIGRNIRAMDRLTRVVFAVFLVLALVTGVVAFDLARNLTSSMTILNLPGIALENGQTTVQPGAAFGIRQPGKRDHPGTLGWHQPRDRPDNGVGLPRLAVR